MSARHSPLGLPLSARLPLAKNCPPSHSPSPGSLPPAVDPPPPARPATRRPRPPPRRPRPPAPAAWLSPSGRRSAFARPAPRRLRRLNTAAVFAPAISLASWELGQEEFGKAYPLEMAQRGEDGSKGAGASSKKALFWTPPMSAFMLRSLAEIVAKGVKTDKGFKEIHLNQVAKFLSEYIGGHVSSTQVHNHLRKWRARWVKISQLRDLSGALWKDDNNMIVLEEQHYLGHTKDHPKDAEFLNVPLENYVYMKAIFSTRQATGKFAMGSNEPLGVPIDVDNTCKDDNEGFGVDVGATGFEFGVEELSATTPSPSSSTKKRKRFSFLGEVESTQFSNMSDAVREMADAIKYTVHGDRPVGLYKDVMDLKVFPLNHRLAVLDHLTENKGKCLNFMEMEEDVRVAFVEHFIAKNPDLL